MLLGLGHRRAEHGAPRHRRCWTNIAAMHEDRIGHFPPTAVAAQVGKNLTWPPKILTANQQPLESGCPIGSVRSALARLISQRTSYAARLHASLRQRSCSLSNIEVDDCKC
jgi:hypothetical protein